MERVKQTGDGIRMGNSSVETKVRANRGGHFTCLKIQDEWSPH